MTGPKTFTATLRILIADDHDMIREGLRAALNDPRIEIVAEAKDASSAVRLAISHDVDLVLLDIGFPDQSGFDVLTHIKQAKPALPVLIYSVHDKPHYIERSRALGAAGYLLKGGGHAELMGAIHRATTNQSASSSAR